MISILIPFSDVSNCSIYPDCGSVDHLRLTTERMESQSRFFLFKLRHVRSGFSCFGAKCKDGCVLVEWAVDFSFRSWSRNDSTQFLSMWPTTPFDISC